MAALQPEQRGKPWIPLAVFGGIALLLAALAFWLWPAGDGGPRNVRVIQQITVLQPPPPPPPPPPKPEEKIMEEKPDLVEPTEQPQISEKPAEKPAESNDAPADKPSAEAAGLDRAADAGSDSFRLAAGKGGGLFGGGGGGGGIGWGSYVQLHIERALQRDPRTRSASGRVRVTVNIDPGGRFVGAALRSSTGDAALDTKIRSVLASLPPLGRSRPAGQEGITNATITMKRTDG